MRAKCQTESVAGITGNDVQMAMKYILPRRLAVREPNTYSFALDAAITQRSSDTLRDAKHMRAFFLLQLCKVSSMSIGDYERMSWIDGLMIKKSRAAIIPVNHADFNLACDQLANYTVFGFGHILELATAFGVRLFGTALVVISDSTDFRGRKTPWTLSDHCRKIQVDYQSGSEQPHSKASGGLCMGFKKSNHHGLLIFFKMAMRRAANLLSQTRQVISLGENCLA
jgi:hypothetical protein